MNRPYWCSNLPRNLPWQEMIDTVMGRWRIERDYEELKQELGLGHYEGRNWRASIITESVHRRLRFSDAGTPRRQ